MENECSLLQTCQKTLEELGLRMDQGLSCCWTGVIREEHLLLIFDHNDVCPQKCIAINTCVVPLSLLALTMIEVVEISAKIFQFQVQTENLLFRI